MAFAPIVETLHRPPFAFQGRALAGDLSHATAYILLYDRNSARRLFCIIVVARSECPLRSDLGGNPSLPITERHRTCSWRRMLVKFSLRKTSNPPSIDANRWADTSTHYTTRVYLKIEAPYREVCHKQYKIFIVPFAMITSEASMLFTEARQKASCIHAGDEWRALY
jgi:hypothetical protein